MKMKSSKYNIYTTSDDRYYVYNQLTGAFSEVDDELFRCLKQNSCLERFPQELTEGVVYFVDNEDIRSL